MWIHPELQAHNRLGPSKDPSSVTSYAPSVNLSRSPREQQVGGLQEERHTRLEQAKSQENILLSQDIKVDEADQI